LSWAINIVLLIIIAVFSLGIAQKVGWKQGFQDGRGAKQRDYDAGFEVCMENMRTNMDLFEAGQKEAIKTLELIPRSQCHAIKPGKYTGKDVRCIGHDTPKKIEMYCEVGHNGAIAQVIEFSIEKPIRMDTDVLNFKTDGGKLLPK
jgi:hypothetical protein